MDNTIKEFLIYSMVALVALQLIGIILSVFVALQYTPGKIIFSGFPFMLYYYSCSAGSGGVCGYGNNLEVVNLILDVIVAGVIAIGILVIKRMLKK